MRLFRQNASAEKKKKKSVGVEIVLTNEHHYQEGHILVTLLTQVNILLQA